jgi:hypothetical protein
VPGATGVRDLVVEEFAFDRLQDERGRWEKDISHDGCRYLTRDEMERVLNAKVPVRREAEGRYGKIETAPAPKPTRAKPTTGGKEKPK